MKYEKWVAAAVTAGVVACATTLSGCDVLRVPARGGNTAPAPASAPGDLKTSTVTYIHDVCELPKEQRDPALRELNQSLVPNHAVIYCGRAGTP